MQIIGINISLHQRANDHNQAVCPRVAQVDRAFNPAAGDLDRPSELRIFKLDIPYYPSAGDWIPSNGTGLATAPALTVLQKAGRELAAAVWPVRILIFVGIEWGRTAVLVEVGFLALFDLRPSPALSGLNCRRASRQCRSSAPSQSPSALKSTSGRGGKVRSGFHAGMIAPTKHGQIVSLCLVMEQMCETGRASRRSETSRLMI